MGGAVIAGILLFDRIPDAAQEGERVAAVAPEPSPARLAKAPETKVSPAEDANSPVASDDGLPVLNLRLLATTVVVADDSEYVDTNKIILEDEVVTWGDDFKRATVEDMVRQRRHVLVEGSLLRGYEGVVLSEIGSDYVVIDNNGVTITLVLDPESMLQPEGRDLVWPSEVDPYDNPSMLMRMVNKDAGADQWDPEDEYHGALDLYGARKRMAALRVQRDEYALGHQGAFAPWKENGRMVGMLVSDITTGSFYSQLGLRPYDIIESVNGQDIYSPEDTKEILVIFEQASELELTVYRNGKRVTLLARTVLPN